MRWFTTFLLLVLVAGSAFWAWKGDSITSPKAAATSSPASEALAQLTAEGVTSLTLTNDKDTLSLVRGADGTWTQPGNWPVRQDDAKALLAVLANLKSRFQPITPEADLKAYGLDGGQKPIKVELGGDAKKTMLTIGRPAAKSDEPEYARPTYVKVDDHTELLRFDSDLMSIVSRKPEEYRRKQLFPEFDRVKLSGEMGAGTRTALANNDITAVKFETKDGTISLKRVAPNPTPKADRESTSEPPILANKLASSWELDGYATNLTPKNIVPLRDKLDPAKLRAIVTNIPELWAEQFLPAKPATETGLDKPERTITIVRKAGPTTLKIGKSSRTIIKPGATPPPPAQPFAPPPPPAQPTIETYHYASIDGLDLLFEIKADKFNDLFPKLEELRDANLARIENDDVVKIEIAHKGQPTITLNKKRGDKKAEKDDEKQDRWYVGDILAESSKVTEMLEALTKLEAKNPPPSNEPLLLEKPMTPPAERNIIDNPDAKKLADLALDGMSAITLTLQEKASDGQAPPAQTIKYLLGKHDTEKKKLNVQVAGWPRVNIVADDVKKLLDRPALAYRGRRLFDTAEAKLTGVTVTKGMDIFTLQKADTKWKLTKPIAIDADDAKANTLTGDLSRLEVTEYVDDAPKPEDLEKKYGLAKPAMTLDLAFGTKTEKLDIGSSPEFKPEVYARRNGTGSVFTLPKATIDSLKDGSLAFLPLQLWSVPPDKVTALEITRDDGKETYKLTSDAGSWKISGPFDAPVPFLAAQSLGSALSNVRAEKYDAATADAAKHGFDKPSMKLVVSYKDGETPTTRTLLLGKPADGPNMRFAKLADGPNTSVFVLNDTILKDVDKPALELLDKTILNQQVDKLTKVQIVGPKADENVTLVKDDKGTWKAEGANFTPDKPTVDMLLNFTARPLVQKIAAYGANAKWAEYGLDKPEYTITGTYTDAGKTETHSIKLNSKTRFARIDDGLAAAVMAPFVAEALARGKLDFADRSLLNFDAPALTSILRKKDKEELEIVQGATVGWDIVKPAKLKGDQAILDELSEQLSKLRGTKVAAYGTKDLKPFGLDAPDATITLKVGLDKPVDQVLKIGKPVDEKQPDGDRFVMVDGKPEVSVGVLPGTLAKRLLGEPLKFRDRELARFTKADRIEMTRGDRTVTFADVNGTWKLVKPTEAEAEQGDIDEFLNALAKLRADELEAEKPKELKAYGLDKPSVIWTLMNGDKEVLSLLVGSTKEKRAFVKLANGDLIGILDPAMTAKVTGEYRKRAVWTGVDAAQVERIDFKVGDTPFTFNKVGTNWTDSAKPTDTIDSAMVSELLDALAGLKAQRFASDRVKEADLKLFGLAPPQRIISISQRGGTTKTIQIGREEGGSNGSRLYARIDEKDRSDVFVLSEADTLKLAKDRAALLGKP